MKRKTKAQLVEEHKQELGLANAALNVLKEENEDLKKVVELMQGQAVDAETKIRRGRNHITDAAAHVRFLVHQGKMKPADARYLMHLINESGMCKTGTHLFEETMYPYVVTENPNGAGHADQADN